MSYNNLDIGRIQGKHIVDKIKEGNNIMINGPISDLNAINIERTTRSFETLYRIGKTQCFAGYNIRFLELGNSTYGALRNSTDFTQVQGYIAAIDSLLKQP